MTKPLAVGVTVTDVAARAGVSVSTAARALGDYGSVSPRSRERVRSAADELGYRPNMVARSMITKSTRTVGVIVGDIENPFFLRALRGITNGLRRSDYDMLLANSDEDGSLERRALQIMSERRVDGIILTPADTSDRGEIADLVKRGVPVVQLDRRIHGLAVDSVGIHNRDAACQATEYLIAAGHERIALVTGAAAEDAAALQSHDVEALRKVRRGTSAIRAAGYRRALAAAGVPFHPEYVPITGFRREDAREATRALMSLPTPPTAILSLDGLLTLGVLEGFRVCGISCPSDCSLIGFDDAEWAEVVNPPVTVISQPVLQLGERAASRLVQRMNGELLEPRAIRLSATLIERSSVAPPPPSD